MWDDVFDKPEYHYGTEPAGFLLRHEHWLTPGARALSVADGEGRNSVFLAQKGLTVTAMDASPKARDKALALAAARGVSVDYRLADIAEWDWAAGQWDLVAGIFIQFLPPPLRAQVFAGMVEALAPGGVLMIHGYTPEQIAHGTGGPRNPALLYTEDLLREAFGALDIRELDAYEAEISEGAGHSGRSALIDLVAVKPR